MAQVPVGAKGEHRLLVTSEMSIDFMGVDGTRVLATPYLVWYLEIAARNAMLPYLEDGYDSVGTDVTVKHLAATPLGWHVTFKAEVIKVEDRRVLCKVEAWDEKEKVAEGTHERFIVNIDRFASRVQAKAAGQ